MEIILFIGLIIAFVSISNLKTRIKKLEQHAPHEVSEVTHTSTEQGAVQSHEIQDTHVSDELVSYVSAQLAKGINPMVVKQAVQDAGWQEKDITAAFTRVGTMQGHLNTMDHKPVEPGVLERFGAWLKEEWMLKLGAGLLLIAFGWLVTYAFVNNWIGPMGRIAIGLVAGTMFLLFGWQRIRSHIHQGGVFLVLGSTIILLTTFAARSMYDYFTPGFALFVMFLSTVFVALASVRFKSNALALGSLILAGIAPLLTSSAEPSFVSLFTYLLVVVLGAIWIVALTGKRELTTAALIIVGFYSLPHLFSFTGADRGALLLFAYAFVIIFFFTNTIGILKAKGSEIKADLITAMGNGIFLLAWILVAASQEWKSLIITAWTVVFMVGAFSIYSATRRKEPFYVYAGVGIAMLAAATATELSGAALTIAYTIECALIVFLGYVLLKNVDLVQKLSYLFIGPILLSFGSVVASSWRKGVFHDDFFVLLLLAVALLVLGIFFLSRAKSTNDPDLLSSSMTFSVIGSLYIYVLIWLAFHAAFANESTAVMVSLVIYTVIGLTTYFSGLKEEQKELRIYGGILVGFVVCRLLLVDVWDMEMSGRIITFFLIGTLLISTAFLGRKRIESGIN